MDATIPRNNPLDQGPTTLDQGPTTLDQGPTTLDQAQGTLDQSLGLECKNLRLIRQCSGHICRECALTDAGIGFMACKMCDKREGATPEVTEVELPKRQPISESLLAHRLEVCTACESYVAQTELCKKCGCVGRYKRQTVCPLKKWEEYEDGGL